MIYTRAYSRSSAGQLVSAKGPTGDPLSHSELLNEFRSHAKRRRKAPTALVSVSDRIIDTVNRAFEKHYGNNEAPADIWIAFVEVPAQGHEILAQTHAAERLAEECEFAEPSLFHHELVFEWAIPEKYLVHKVSLQTLMDRGLQGGKYGLVEPGLVSTAKLRRSVAVDFEPCRPWHGPWEIGVQLGSFARMFGARAPLDWIAHQLLYDCVQTKILDNDVVRIKYFHGHSQNVGFDFFDKLDDGINTVLYDWWLADIDFFLDHQEFKLWRNAMKDNMVWDMIEFWETWHDGHGDGTVRDSSDMGNSRYYKSRDTMFAKHTRTEAAIEAEAVKLGL